MDEQKTATWNRIKEVLDEALELPASDRSAFVARHCPNPEVHRQILSILAAYDSGGLDQPFLSLERPSGVAEGQEIGPWRLERLIGEGGMGTVFLASRSDASYTKQVALKVLRGGWVGEESRRRFRIERQVLADLEHPGIAKLLDGGDTPDGQPFLVMEYVEGSPLEDYCNQQGLDLEARLALFLDVCSAVQYAHQKLIVHRDLKPSNVLVSREGVVKLLDFGIAKILRPDEFSEPILATQTGLMPMTPAFASPEQVRGGSITTASDVYALGLILYRLLTGEHPYSVQGHNLEELVETVCRGEVASPSQRVAQAKGETQFSHWRMRLRGDLDAIVLKALAKNSDERYSSAEQLADDIQRFLRSEPVRAQRDTFSYRSAKFVRRHYLPLTAAASAFVLLIAGILTLYFQRERLIVERNRAKAVASFVIELFQLPDPGTSLGAKITALELVDKSSRSIEEELRNDPEVLATMMATLGETYHNLGQLPQASKMYEGALALHERFAANTTWLGLLWQRFRDPVWMDPVEHIKLLERLSVAAANRGRWREALGFADRALAAGPALIGEEHPILAQVQARWAFAAHKIGRRAEAEAMFDKALSAARRDHDQDVLSTVLGDYAQALHRQGGQNARAIELYREAIEIEKSAHGERSPRIGQLQMAIASLAFENDPDGAEQELRRMIDEQRKFYQGEHMSVATGLNNLGYLLERRQRFTEAEVAYLEALEIFRKTLGESHAQVATVLGNLGSLALTRGQTDRALELLEKSSEIFRRELGEDHPEFALAQANLASVETERRNFERARELSTTAVQVLESRLGPEHPRLAGIWMIRSDLEAAAGHPNDAVPLATRAVEIARAGESLDLPILLFKLCRAQSNAERFGEAIPCYQEVLRAKNTGRLVPLWSRSWLAKAQLVSGDLQGAEASARQAWKDWGAEPDGAYWVLSAQQILGESLLRQGRLAEAEKVLEERRRGAENLEPPDPAILKKIAAEFAELEKAKSGGSKEGAAGV